MAKSITDFQDLTQPQQKLLSVVEQDKNFTDTFFFTGGTLLKALGIVPRQSNDLDFFTFSHVSSDDFFKAQLHVRDLVEQAFGAESIEPSEKGFLHTESGMVIDIVADGSKNIDEFVSFGNLQAASMKDLAAHKASALCSRDELKDYIDIAFLTKQQQWSLRDLEYFAEQKFQLGTIREEKMLTELLAKREMFTIDPAIFLRSPEENKALVEHQITTLIEQTSL